MSTKPSRCQSAVGPAPFRRPYAPAPEHVTGPWMLDIAEAPTQNQTGFALLSARLFLGPSERSRVRCCGRWEVRAQEALGGARNKSLVGSARLHNKRPLRREAERLRERQNSPASVLSADRCLPYSVLAVFKWVNALSPCAVRPLRFHSGVRDGLSDIPCWHTDRAVGGEHTSRSVSTLTISQSSLKGKG